MVTFSSHRKCEALPKRHGCSLHIISVKAEVQSTVAVNTVSQYIFPEGTSFYFQIIYAPLKSRVLEGTGFVFKYFLC